MTTQHIHRFPWGSGDDAQVWIVHFGSKSTPLIAQLCREIGLKSRVINSEELLSVWDTTPVGQPRLVILSGGNQSVFDRTAPRLDYLLYKEMRPCTTILGICYGAQLLAELENGIVERAKKPEFGEVRVTCQGFGEYRGGMAVMNHRDEIVVLPEKWNVIASTERCANAFVRSSFHDVFAVQFHPEMDHTENGEAILRHIAFDVAECKPDYHFDPHQFITEARTWLSETCPNIHLICGLSGGVDSSVVFQLSRGTGRQTLLRGMYVDTGWMRDGELDEIREIFGDEDVLYVDAADRFHGRIEAVRYPTEQSPVDCEGVYYEAVRRAIGGCFIDVFAEETNRFLDNVLPSQSAEEQTPERRDVFALLQGTNASDIIESETGLKAHHNVGGLPDVLQVEIVEPLAGLYKFEIRELAKALELPDEIVYRQPFPGPGLALRTWGKLSRDLAPPLQAANRILEEVVRKHYPDPQTRPCQYYVALDPSSSVGLMGDARVNGLGWKIRMVKANKRESYSTLDIFEPSWAFLREITARLTTEIAMPDGTPFDRVYYEITGKPPSTTEPH